MAGYKVSVILPAAGAGQRFGGEANKTFAKIDSRPMFIRALEHFINREDVCQTILVVAESDLEEMKSKYAANLGFMGVTLAHGGETRMDSVRAGLEKVSDEADLVAIHDAARPCVTADMIDRVFAEASKTAAAILACPLHGTIKRVGQSGVIDETLPRAGLWEAQTPQVFKRELLRRLYDNPPTDAENVTDDAQLAELAGHPVAVVAADRTNLKVTTKGDLTLAKAIIKARPPGKPAKSLGAFEEAQW